MLMLIRCRDTKKLEKMMKFWWSLSEMSSSKRFFPFLFFCPLSLPLSCLKVVAYLVYSCDFYPPPKCVFVITVFSPLKSVIATKAEGAGRGGGGPAPEGAVRRWSVFEVWEPSAEGPSGSSTASLGSWLEIFFS